MPTSPVQAKRQSKDIFLQCCKFALVAKSTAWLISATPVDPWSQYIAQDDASENRQTQPLVSGDLRHDCQLPIFPIIVEDANMTPLDRDLRRAMDREVRCSSAQTRGH